MQKLIMDLKELLQYMQMERDELQEEVIE